MFSSEWSSEKNYRENIPAKLEQLKIPSIHDSRIYELLKRNTKEQDLSATKGCYQSRAKDCDVNSLPMSRCKAKKFSVEVRTIHLLKALKKAQVFIPRTLISKISKNSFLHNFRGNFIIENLVNVVFK